MRFLKFTRSLIAFSLCFATGCASIVSGGPKTLPILSRPEADCEIIDARTGLAITKTRTPFTASLSNDAGFFQPAHYRVRISREGYIPREVEVKAGLNGWYLGNIVFGGLIGILIVDPATGAMWKIHEDAVSVDLYPDSVEGRKRMSEDESRREMEEREANEKTVQMGY
jgi:hypothetical protein